MNICHPQKDQEQQRVRHLWQPNPVRNSTSAINSHFWLWVLHKVGKRILSNRFWTTIVSCTKSKKVFAFFVSFPAGTKRYCIWFRTSSSKLSNHLPVFLLKRQLQFESSNEITITSTHEYIRVTYKYIRVHTSNIRVHTSTYEQHTSNTRVHTSTYGQNTNIGTLFQSFLRKGNRIKVFMFKFILVLIV